MSTPPPHDTQAEQGVLGSLLIDKEAIVEVADFLRPEDFYYDAHGVIMRAVLDLHKDRSPLDLITLVNHLESKKMLKAVGGATYLSTLLNAEFTASHIRKYAEIVKEKARRRQVNTLSLHLQSSLQNEEVSTKAVVESFVGALVNITEDRKCNSGKVSDILSDVVSDWDLVATNGFGLPTGIERLDEAVRGYRDGHYWLVMADTNIGKTSFAIMLLHHFLNRNPKECAVFFSSEMTYKEMAEKVVAREANMSVYDLPQNMEGEVVIDALAKVTESNLFIYNNCRTVKDIQMKIEYLKLRGYKPKLVFIDYIQNLNGRGSNTTEKLEGISGGLQDLAIYQKFCLVVMSQIPKSEKDVHPYSVHPKGASLIKDHSGICFFIQRDVKEEEANERAGRGKVHLAQVAMTKNRYGPRTHLKVWIDMAVGHYYPLKPQQIMIAGSQETSTVFT